MEEDAAAATSSWSAVEHMFDKVVTPSDVGKLNRLVIPKQHAERHFPLRADDTRTGLLLRFEDRDGRAWRFRYSYWHSSQSYVITKGWSRFVKDKALSPGDLVSFHRGPGGTLFIDCRRRRPPAVRTWCPFLFSHPLQPPPPLHYPNPSRPPAGHMVGPMRGAEEGVVLGSVPVVRRAAAAAKQLRLFGVTVDCPNPDSDALDDHQS